MERSDTFFAQIMALNQLAEVSSFDQQIKLITLGLDKLLESFEEELRTDFQQALENYKVLLKDLDDSIKALNGFKRLLSEGRYMNDLEFKRNMRFGRLLGSFARCRENLEELKIAYVYNTLGG